MVAEIGDVGHLLVVQEINWSLLPYVQGIFGNQLKVPWQAQAEALGVNLCGAVGIAALI